MRDGLKIRIAKNFQAVEVELDAIVFNSGWWGNTA